jgi:hypothetical protein
MARLAKKAKRGMILYRGVEMRAVVRDRLIASQDLPTYTSDVRPFARIRFGKETFGPHPCSMCGALPGDLHTHADVWGCPYERCPFCYVPGDEQYIGHCSCPEGATWRVEHGRPEGGSETVQISEFGPIRPFEARVPGSN